MTSTAPTQPTVLGGVFETAAADPSVRAADDLFRHANGTWLATAEIPADRASTGPFQDLRDQSEIDCRTIIEQCVDGTISPDDDRDVATIATLYSTFMDETRIDAAGATPLEPELVPFYEASSKDELLVALGRGFASSAPMLIGAGVEVDLNNPERYSTWVAQSGLSLPDESYYREESREEIRRDFVKHVATMLTMADVDAKLGKSADDLSTALMEFETELASHHWDQVTCRDVEKSNNPMTFEEMAASAPGLDWMVWREAVGGGEKFLTNLIVGQPDYITNAAALWEKTDLEVLRIWALWHIVHARATLLSSDFVNENFQFYSHKLTGVDQLRDRWKRGVGLVEACIGEGLGRLYVARHFPPQHKALMDQLVADLIEAYRQSITTLEWMSDETRERALDKLSKFTPKIGYPVSWRDYSSIKPLPGDLLACVRQCEQADFEYETNKLNGPVNRDEWHMTPQTVNAYYNPVQNEIAFPAAILQPPFFDPEVDPAVNYAGIGAVIGHEIGHGFDDQGSEFDGEGKVSNWWTDADRKAFEERTAELSKQYDAYIPEVVAKKYADMGKPDAAPHVNGALTIGENIGDLGGLSIALKAYAIILQREGINSLADAPVIDGLTGVQRFFYSWARIWRAKARADYQEMLLSIDPHSPSEFRCNGIVRNLDAFYEAFNVTSEDGLWLDPDKRVSIW
ncbi:M13 family metallopeptidase [Actinomyces vulturis]|uniref:M13 family metallopeptidase n=1 Tax=Actinomyces vulturis TaxID=1857645 RepID=UPI000833ED30|nr:M13-type metalloendopeptidase [Actinomyces vulturis]